MMITQWRQADSSSISVLGTAAILYQKLVLFHLWINVWIYSYC